MCGRAASRDVFVPDGSDVDLRRENVQSRERIDDAHHELPSRIRMLAAGDTAAIPAPTSAHVRRVPVHVGYDRVSDLTLHARLIATKELHRPRAEPQAARKRQQRGPGPRRDVRGSR